MTNQESLGYMLTACKELNLDKQTAARLEQEMETQFDLKTEQEAKETGYAWLYENQ